MATIRRDSPQKATKSNRDETWGDQTVSFVLNSLARLHKDEEGQGLVEYLLILALVAFAVTAGMGTLASSINQSFSSIGSLLNAYIA